MDALPLSQEEVNPCSTNSSITGMTLLGKESGERSSELLLSRWTPHPQVREEVQQELTPDVLNQSHQTTHTVATNHKIHEASITLVWVI